MGLEVVFDVSGCFVGMRCGLIRCTVSSALGNETIKRDLAVFLFSNSDLRVFSETMGKFASGRKRKLPENEIE